MLVIPAAREALRRRLKHPGQPGKNVKPYLKNKLKHTHTKDWCVTLEYLPSKRKALS
jgi:hypothetical protein